MYTYHTKGTCSKQIDIELDGNIIKHVKFYGGCDGNLQAIPKLVEGMTIDEVEKRLSGISCNGRPTSCGDQLARACREAYEDIQIIRFCCTNCLLYSQLSDNLLFI